MHNAAGCHLGLRVTNGHNSSGTESVVHPNEVCMLRVPVDVIASTSASERAPASANLDAKSMSFPCVIVKSYLSGGGNVDYYQSDPIPLHILTLNSISICPRM